MSLSNCICIALGGALGALSRYGLSYWINNRVESIFPLGTFLVNMLGCFFMGLIYSLTLQKANFSPELQNLLTIGFLGSFTTFSTFSLETFNLIQNNQVLVAGENMFFSVFLGIFALWLGTKIFA